MHLSEELAQVDSAEDLFARYGVHFDPQVMAVHRLHVLRRFGIEVQRLEAQSPPLNELQRDHLYQRVLAEAQAHFANPGYAANPPIAAGCPVLVNIRRSAREMVDHELRSIEGTSRPGGAKQS